MRRSLLLTCALVLTGVLGTQRANADLGAPYDANADLHRRIEELERIVAQMPGAQTPMLQAPAGGRMMLISDGQQPTPATASATPDADIPGIDAACGDATCCYDPDHVGQDFFNSTCRTGGFVAGAEVVFLKPFATNGDLPGSFPIIGTQADFQFESTPRFWLGYVRPSGLGSQFRYWEFDHSVDGSLNDDPNDLITGRLKFRTFDWELLQQVNFSRWWLQMSGGLRYAEINIDERLTLNNSSILRSSYNFGSGFDGVGLTAGLQATRALTKSGNLQMTAGGRASLLFGDRKYFFDIEFANIDLFDFNTRNDNDLVGIFELNVGPRYTRRLANGANVFVGGGFEGQLWQGSGTAFSTPFDTSLGSIGFAGLGANIGFTR